ncbi:helix-turn-helix domain-containing protein [Neobacillus niacini]|uniref:helix-turn-helix domain-containing protein n=1 Tax=Neobacillus niacini TaxID=86668 RepID=UPI002FFFF6EF
MISRLDKLKELCNLASLTYDLTTFFISPAGEVIFECVNKEVLNPLYGNEKQNLFNAIQFDPNKKYSFPVIRKTVFFEDYIMISVLDHNVFEGTLLIGPSISSKLSDEKINGLINDTGAYFYKEQVSNYFKALPILQYDKLLHISVMAFYLFNQQLLSAKYVMNKNGVLAQPIENNEKISITVSTNLQKGAFHHDPLEEKKLLNIIKEGRVEDLKDFFNMMNEEVAGILSKSSYIRTSKNQIIILITLVTRSAIDGGLHPEIAFTLSDTYIQRVEELNHDGEIKRLAREVLYTFTEKVLQTKNERFSKTITTCKNYIYNHLYEEINHDDLAELVDLHPNYLSVLFKKEVGIPVNEYIQQAKIDEAKKLLAYSHTPISEICSLLNFSDQSYFTKVFKRYAGITPKLYRERHHLLEDK